MQRTSLGSIAVMLLMSLTAGAQQAPPHIARSELGRHTFDVGGVDLTVVKLDDNVSISSDMRDPGAGYVVVRVGNGSDAFERFDPGEVVLVSADGEQATIAYERRNTDRVEPRAIPVAPGAHTEMKYNLSARLRFPLRLYYGATLLAEISD
jgi:hypothetical protein